MGWLAASIIFVGGITYFAIHYARFRRLLFWIGVAALCLEGAAWLTSRIQDGYAVTDIDGH
jgi:hypothetical protein